MPFAGPPPPAPPPPLTPPASLIAPGTIPCFSSESTSLTLLLASSLVVALAALALWVSCLRSTVPSVYAPSHGASVPWIARLFKTPVHSLRAALGPNAHDYLRVQLGMAGFSGALALGFVAVLVPLYFWGGAGGPESSGCLFQQTTALHDLLWATVIATGLVVGTSTGLARWISALSARSEPDSSPRRPVTEASFLLATVMPDDPPPPNSLRRALNLLFVIMLMITWQIPIAALFVLNADVENNKSPASRMIFGYLVPCLLLLTVRVGLPYLLLYLAKKEGFPTRSALEDAVMVRYWWFLFINTLVAPMIFASSSNLAAAERVGSLGGPANIARTMGASLTTASSFFMCYLIVSSLFVTLARLLRLGPLIVTVVGRRTVEPEVFEYYVEYVDGALVLAIAIAYAALAPLVLPVALAYFVVKHYADKYNLTNVHPAVIGRGTPRPVPTFVLSGTVVAWVASLGFVGSVSSGTDSLTYSLVGVAWGLVCALTGWFAVPS